MATVETTVGWVNSPRGRGTAEVLFTNFAALFVCVWSVLHHNLKARDDNEWTIVARKLRWCAVAIIAPEVLTLFAIMQWNAANISVGEMKRLGYKHWTKVHAFYANAGGFVLETPDFPRFPVNATSIKYLVETRRIPMPNITKDQIWDQSKADRFAKWVSFLQAGWILFQIIARSSQGLAITPLEVFTVAFIIPTLTTTYLWSSKPQNVAQPTIIQVDWTIGDLLLSAGEAAKDPYVDTPLDFVEKPVWDGWARFPSLLHFGNVKSRPLARIPNDYSPPPPAGIEAIVVWIVGVAHAMIHLISWDFSFPSRSEQIVWRVCSLAMLGVMTIGGLVPVLSTRHWFDFDFSLVWMWIRRARRQTFIRRWLVRVFSEGAYTAYIIARLFICVEVFASFRLMPREVYDGIDFQAFWPHL